MKRSYSGNQLIDGANTFLLENTSFLKITHYKHNGITYKFCKNYSIGKMMIIESYRKI